MDPNTDPAFIAELGDYRLVKLIGSGAFGEVFLARDSSGAECVLKLMKKKSSMDAVWNARAFEQEARTLRLIANNYQGHYIVKLLNYHKGEAMSYVALEYLPDLDLETWRHNNPVIESLEDTMRLFFSQLLEGIVSLHEMGITHRDLKPPNVLLRRSSMWTEERGKKSILAFTPVLTDFGTAAIRGSPSSDDFATQNQFQTFAGTAFFMAPEVRDQSSGYSTLADVWSFGVLILIFFLNPSRSFNARIGPEALLQQLKDKVSKELFDLLNQMLRPKASDRIGWAELKKHDWFKITPEQAYLMLEAQETDERIEKLKRPAEVEARHLKFGALSRIPQSSDNVNRSATPSQYEFTVEEMLNAVSLDSADGRIFCGLLEARELAREMEAKLKEHHGSFDVNRNRFHSEWVAPMVRRVAEADLLVATFEPFRAISTQRTILKFALMYHGLARFSLALEVAKVCMDKLKRIATQHTAFGAQGRTNSGPSISAHLSPSSLTPGPPVAHYTGSQIQSSPNLHISGSGVNGATHGAIGPNDANFIRPELALLWEKLFEQAREALQSYNVRDAEEDENSPIHLLGPGTDFPFFAVAHATCKLLYKDCVNWLLPILQPAVHVTTEEDEEFLRRFGGSTVSITPKTPTKSLDNVMVRLQEVRLVMEYVRTTLPSLTAATGGLSANHSYASHFMFGSGTSAGTPTQAKRSGSSHSVNSSTASSPAPVLGDSMNYNTNGYLDNDRNCLDLIESVSKVIRRLPDEMKQITQK